MPTIDNFHGIKIHVYNGEHRPPHIHAVYNEFEVLVSIEDGEIYAGCRYRRSSYGGTVFL